MTQDELKLVLETLKWCHGGEPCGTAEAIAVVEKALAQPEQEPVAFASIKIRVGNQQVEKLLTQIELHHAIDPWGLVEQAAEMCIEELKEKNS